MNVTLAIDGDRVTVHPRGLLGPGRLATLQACCGQAGARWDGKARRYHIGVDAAHGLVRGLEASGFVVDAPGLVWRSMQEAVASVAQTDAAVETMLAEREARVPDGRKLHPYQRTGVRWLMAKNRRLLGDSMGCVDGAASVRVWEGGVNATTTLRDLARASGQASSDAPARPRYIWALCGDAPGWSQIVDVIAQGTREVVRLECESGRRLRLTPDHEVWTADGRWVRADALARYDRLMVLNRTTGKLQTVDVHRVVADGSAEVYDVVCADPHRNFIANGVVVHNCGKTPEALMAIPASPTLVVTRASLKGVWLDEAAKWRPDLRAVGLEGLGAFRWPAPGEIVMVNWELLPGEKNAPPPAAPGQKPKKPRRLVKVPDWSTNPMPPNLTLICDEAHDLSTSRSLRSSRFRLLADCALRSGGRVWLLTGTPLTNRPTGLWNVLRAASLEMEAFGSWPAFKRLFQAKTMKAGKNEWTTWGMPGDDARRQLAKVMLRRTRAEVLPELPPCTYQTQVVPIDAATIRACDAAMAALQAAGIELSSATLRADLQANEIAFAAMSAAMAALSAAKIPAMLELVESYESAEEPLVVFSASRAPIDVLGTREGWATITGGIPGGDRADIAERFRGGRYRGLACTIAAGGVGLTFCGGVAKAAHALFVSTSWSPSDNDQARCRIVRIGQDRGVLVRYLVGDHPLDRRLAEVTTAKNELIDRTIGLDE